MGPSAWNKLIHSLIHSFITTNEQAQGHWTLNGPDPEKLIVQGRWILKLAVSRQTSLASSSDQSPLIYTDRRRRPLRENDMQMNGITEEGEAEADTEKASAGDGEIQKQKDRPVREWCPRIPNRRQRSSVVSSSDNNSFKTEHWENKIK